MNILFVGRFCGYLLWDITKWDYIKGSFLCILGSFLEVEVQNEEYFFGLLKCQIYFWGCLKFLIFFGGER